MTKPGSLHLVYFTATDTTYKVLKYISEGFGIDHPQCHNITKGVDGGLVFGSNDIVLLGMPVYAGRIPAVAADYLKKIEATNTPAVVVCVYGNRHYDDALVELKDIAVDAGFKVVAAGTFIARHSIFPFLANNRPDSSDRQQAKEFGAKAAGIIANQNGSFELFPDIEVFGNRPYKPRKVIPLYPSGNRRCNNCNVCVENCPVGAIDSSTPRKTDENRCISCGRCIHVCPTKARRFGGLKYHIVAHKFKRKFATPRENEFFYPTEK